jgi:hypothetical protein
MRSSFDKLISWTGLVLAAVLLMAGGLLTYASTFIGDQVDEQLTMQDITMPEGEALASLPKDDAAALKQYAGSPLDTGPEAKAFADHYILAHMMASSEGKSYSTVSGEQRALASDPAADPEKVAELTALKETMLNGNTLRGMLLFGYAFATMGTIAGIAGIAAFAGAGALILLFIAGLVHARKAEATEKNRVAVPVSG